MIDNYFNPIPINLCLILVFLCVLEVLEDFQKHFSYKFIRFIELNSDLSIQKNNSMIKIFINPKRIQFI